MAIPLVLGTALGAYGHCRGTAGAIFGLAYYVLIGLGLAAVGWGQSLGGTLIVCASVSCIAGLRYGCCLRDMRARLTRPRGSARGRQPFAAGGIEKMDFLAPYRQR
jgi:hypothetical protein